MSMDLFTSFEGRISRKQFWLGLLAMIGVALVIVLLLRPGEKMQALFGLLFLYPMGALMAKRLHDRNKPTMPWLAIYLAPSALLNLMLLLGIGFTPVMMSGQQVLMPTMPTMIIGFISFIIGVWALIDLGILKGTDGDNAYGPDPVRA